jgi:hypothetical protein
MPAALCLIFIAAPIIAALSLDSDTFVTFLILYCVTAGLCTSSADTSADPIENRSEENRRSCEPRSIHAANSPPGHPVSHRHPTRSTHRGRWSSRVSESKLDSLCLNCPIPWENLDRHAV